jgi:hypothetical protein
VFWQYGMVHYSDFVFSLLYKKNGIIRLKQLYCIIWDRNPHCQKGGKLFEVIRYKIAYDGLEIICPFLVFEPFLLYDYSIFTLSLNIQSSYYMRNIVPNLYQWVGNQMIFYVSGFTLGESRKLPVTNYKRQWLFSLYTVNIQAVGIIWQPCLRHCAALSVVVNMRPADAGPLGRCAPSPWAT